jgi:hypothetical protein
MFIAALLDNKDKRPRWNYNFVKFVKFYNGGAKASGISAREHNFLESLGIQKAVKSNTRTNYVRTNEN